MSDEPRNTIDESISHIKNTYKVGYPKTDTRHSIGNMPANLHEEFAEFCAEQNIGHAEAIAALLDFVGQHEAHYVKEIAALRKENKRK